MKKIKEITIFGVMLFTSFTLTSCGGNVEKDAKKLADLQCEAKEATENLSQNGGTDFAEREKTRKINAATSFANEMKEKYQSESEHNKFNEAYSKAMKKCD